MHTTGILFDIKKFAVHDGPGIRTTIFFKGCPLDCRWCHNPESRKQGAEVIEKITRRKCLNLSYSETKDYIGREISVPEVMAEIEKDIVFYDDSGGGVTFSGGEPLLQPDFLRALLRECKTRSLHTAVDTCGYAPLPVMKDVAASTDLFLYDVKIMDPKKHQLYTGVDNTCIMENLKFLLENNYGVEIRIPVVPDITDTEENIHQIIAWLQPFGCDCKVSLLAYNKLGKDKYKRLQLKDRMSNTKVPSTKRMEKVKKMFGAKGFSVSIGG